VKLGDFGLATEVTGFLHDVVGSDLYHAPEMFTSKGSVSVTDPHSTVALPAQRSNGRRAYFSCQPQSLELSSGFYPGPDDQCRLFQTFT